MWKTLPCPHTNIKDCAIMNFCLNDTDGNREKMMNHLIWCNAQERGTVFCYHQLLHLPPIVTCTKYNHEIPEHNHMQMYFIKSVFWKSQYTYYWIPPNPTMFLSPTANTSSIKMSSGLSKGQPECIHSITLRHEQNDWYFADDIFRCILF